MKPDEPITEEFKKAKQEAWEKNQKARETAKKHGKEPKVSYSARKDGTVIKFTLDTKQKRWVKADEDGEGEC